MERITVAVVGIEAKDLTVLRSLLNLVAGSMSVSWTQVDEPRQAQLAFLGHLPPAQVEALVQELGSRVLLIQCGEAGAAVPAGVVTARCPPRSQELARIFTEAARRGQEAAAAATAPTPPEPVECFDAERCLAGAIHAMLPRLLIDQPLLVSVPEAPPLLVDVHAGVRTVHADPAWFARPDFWRAGADAWKLATTPNPARWAECRHHGARPYPALRFWGIMSASQGRPVKEIARSAELGLRKPPDFKTLPHEDWQRPLAEAMLARRAPLEEWAAAAARPLSAVVDFLNGCAALGLLRQ